MSIFVVTGAAGFIGSNLVDALLDKNHEVLGIDNLSTGRMENISVANSNNNFKFHNIDLLDTESLNNFFSLNTNIDAVFHLAANADVRDGLNHPRKDLEQKYNCNIKPFRGNAKFRNKKNSFFINWINLWRS